MPRSRMLSFPRTLGPGGANSPAQHPSSVSEIKLKGTTQLFCLVLILLQLMLIWAVKSNLPFLASFDSATAHVSNAFGNAHPQLERQLAWLQSALLIKTIPFLMVVVWCWFASPQRTDPAVSRSQIAAGLAASFVSIALAMMVQKLIGHRERPIFNSDYEFMTFFDEQPNNDVSSFPSDTCALVFGLSTVAFFFSRRAGLFSFAWAVFAVTIPRLLTGLHYVSDVLFSALNGILVVILGTAVLSPLIKLPMVHLLERHRAGVYALTFGLLFEAGRMGGDLRPLLGSLLKAVLA